MIHQYQMLNQNIVLDTSSGGVYSVDKMAYDIIAMFEQNSKQEIIEKISKDYVDVDRSEIEECYAQILELKEQGVLFSSDKFESMAGELKAKTSGVVKALCLHIAHACNLNCEYCFASQGKYHGERALMSFEVGKRALDFLVENSGTRKNLEVDFFGGEPLMNFQVVKDLVKYARSIEKEKNKNFRFTLTTNGVLIDDDVIEFANKEMSNVVLSLDGRKEVHDRYRVDYNGKGSWETILPKFKKLVEARKNKDYYMRGTFTHFNPDFVEDIKEMLKHGFTELSMEPVVCPEGDKNQLTKEDIEVVLSQYEELAKLMLERKQQGKPFTFYHYMIDLKGGPCIYKRISGCGSGTEYMAVTPQGDLYPCHQFVGEEKFKLGNVFEGVTNKEITKEFMDCNVYAREDCKDCWAKLYCSGGCSANAYHATGSVRGVYKNGCELFKKRMECAIALAVIDGLDE
ncbi:MAG: thioether cross-link-forming SCIFF peptide maturase [Clostridia bacterium]|nr:thioether cross-link-forming SCIFF peptide maturase [Clostridia bacterium]